MIQKQNKDAQSISNFNDFSSKIFIFLTEIPFLNFIDIETNVLLSPSLLGLKNLLTN